MSIKRTLLLITAFLGGLGGGISLGYLISKEKHQEKADKEIRSIRAMYEKHFAKKNVDHAEEKNDEKKIPEVDEQDMKDYKDYTKQYISGTNTEPVAEILKPNKSKKEKKVSKKEPYRISGKQLGEFEDYTVVTLYYYTDGVLAYEDDRIVDDPSTILGKVVLGDFGEEDAMYVRDESLKVDYEILVSEKTFSEALDSKVD